MGVVKAQTWKAFVKQAEIAKKSAKKFEPFVPKNKWGVNNKGCDTAQSFQTIGKEIMAVELFGKTPPKPRRSNSNSNPKSKFSQK